jgi:uncharacterized protein (TIGR03435 family)
MPAKWLRRLWGGLQPAAAFRRFSDKMHIALLIAVAGAMFAQTTFEVAAIHINHGGADAPRINTPDGGRLMVTNYSLKALIRRAYDLQGVQISGGPGWLDTEKYDLEAKTGQPEKIKPDELKSLLQNLLADRFRLKVHTENRELTAYALVVTNGGPKLSEHKGAAGTSINDRNGSDKAQMTGDNVSMPLLASSLGNQMDRVVIDKTGLNGGYAFTLEWSPEQSANATGPSILTGLQDQLGLKLESTKAPVEILVIDHAEKPSEN